jgi:hypothetical protein
MSDEHWWAGPVATIISVTVGALMIVFERRATGKAEMKLKLFEELRQGIEAAGESGHEISSLVFMLPMQSNNYWNMVGRGYQMTPVADRFPKINDLHMAAGRKITALISLLETHDIVSEHFELFRRALACACKDVEEAKTELTPVLFRTLPIDLPGNPVPIVQHVTVPQLAELTEKCNRYWNLMQTLLNYIHDIKIEAQNLLLGGIFSRRVPPRKPADPRIWVLRTDDYMYLRQLQLHFFEEHPVAANQIRLEREAAEGAQAEMERAR